jgi:purine-nucleoside phosphorylase
MARSLQFCEGQKVMQVRAFLGRDAKQIILSGDPVQDKYIATAFAAG